MLCHAVGWCGALFCLVVRCGVACRVVVRCCVMYYDVCVVVLRVVV